VDDAEQQWTWVAEQRLALADALDELPDAAWDGPSRCEGWRARDAVGHLVFLAEGNRASVALDLARQLRPPSAALDRIARRVGQASPAELVARLRAASGGRFVVPGQPPAVSLGEVVVHGIDALRPSGAAEPALAPERAQPVAAAYRPIGLVFGTARAARQVRFVATDGDWAVGPPDGPEATGAAVDVVQALAGRPDARAALRGPGVALLGR
jgi:uncharacterized protein (TIGR03083 family)